MHTSSTGITASTRLVALLGYPVTHSWSPQIHNAAFRAQGLDYLYVACTVEPKQIRIALDGLEALDFVGANVTIPHKQTIVRHIDSLSERARAVGAVNTLVRRFNSDGSVHWYGDNTDVPGFLDPLRSYRNALSHQHLCVFGNGGAARAVCYALLSELNPAKLTVVARKVKRAWQVLEALKPFVPETQLDVVEWDRATFTVRDAKLLVNTTPVGMYPNSNESVWPHAKDFHPGHLAYDLIYNPVRTRWLQEVEQAGGRTINGIEMFIGQAAAAYEQWTGHGMPLDVVRNEIARLIRPRTLA